MGFAVQGVCTPVINGSIPAVYVVSSYNHFTLVVVVSILIVITMVATIVYVFQDKSRLCWHKICPLLSFKAHQPKSSRGSTRQLPQYKFVHFDSLHEGSDDASDNDILLNDLTTA